MLSEILKAFKQTGGPPDLNELVRQLGTERSAMDGMLELLVRQGKLRKIRLGSEDCARCKSRSSCAPLQTGSLMGNIYELVE